MDTKLVTKDSSPPARNPLNDCIRELSTLQEKLEISDDDDVDASDEVSSEEEGDAKIELSLFTSAFVATEYRGLHAHRRRPGAPFHSPNPRAAQRISDSSTPSPESRSSVSPRFDQLLLAQSPSSDCSDDCEPYETTYNRTPGRPRSNRRSSRLNTGSAIATSPQHSSPRSHLVAAISPRPHLNSAPPSVSPTSVSPRPPLSPQPSSDHPTNFDWNTPFQELLEKTSSSPDEEHQRQRSLRQLIDSFIATARPIAERLILESFLPSQKRTYSSVQIGGRAGGVKFVINNIFFKFAKDSYGYYGGDSNAAKAAGHEFKSLTEILRCSFRDVHVPLFALFTLYGKRLLASSVLPISSKSLVYGSNDGGHVVHNENQRVNDIMKAAAESLNLKPHQIRSTNKFLCMPGDIEGHLSETDGRFYILDSARMFPASGVCSGWGRVTLYTLLRPELVRANPVPLSSDAFFRWGDPDNATLHNPEVQAATDRLQHELIPGFAQKLDSRELAVTGPEQLELCMHDHGINMRYLGLIYSRSQREHIQRLLLAEMLARTFKSLMQARFRDAKVIVSAADFAPIAVDLFNALFAAPQQTNFWESSLLPMLGRKFRTRIGLPVACTFASIVHARLLLFQRTQALCGVKFQSETPPTHFSTFSVSNISSVYPRIKVMDPFPSPLTATTAPIVPSPTTSTSNINESSNDSVPP